MKFNEIPPAREPAAVSRAPLLRQEHYSGKGYFRVNYGGKTADVCCADKAMALALAAKHWGIRWTSAEYHQAAQVVRLKVNPEFLAG